MLQGKLALRILKEERKKEEEERKKEEEKKKKDILSFILKLENEF